MSALGRCIIFMLFFLYISLRVLLCFFFNLRRSSCAAARWCEWRGHRRVAGVENRWFTDAGSANGRKRPPLDGGHREMKSATGRNGGGGGGGGGPVDGLLIFVLHLHFPLGLLLFLSFISLLLYIVLFFFLFFGGGGGCAALVLALRRTRDFCFFGRIPDSFSLFFLFILCFAKRDEKQKPFFFSNHCRITRGNKVTIP